MALPGTRRPLVVALAAVLALALAGPAVAAEDDPLLPPAGTCAHELDLAATLDEQAEAMRCLVDGVRANAGLPQLAADPSLGRSAIDKADDIVACGDFAHEACGRPTPFWAELDGYAHPIGENIALGTEYALDGSARSTMNRWMRSDGHRANLLDPRYRDFGVGLAQTAAFPGLEGWHTQVWVQQFGLGA